MSSAQAAVEIAAVRKTARARLISSSLAHARLTRRVSWHRSISAGCSHLPRRLSSPALVCMRECAHLTKAEQPRNLRHRQLGVIEVTNCQVAPHVLKYFSKVQPFVRKPSCKRPLAHSQTASDVFHEHFSMRKHR